MENQHRKIEGYRELDESTIANMNSVKEVGLAIKSITDHLATLESVDKRWLDIGVMDLQKGLMSVVRSIAKPGGF